MYKSFAFTICTAVVACTSIPTTDLPLVDLGYTLHQALPSSSNATYYNFTNIQYAVAERFGPPCLPPRNRTVTDGNFTSMCPQANPAWIDTAVGFLSGKNFSDVSPPDLASASLPSPMTYYSEDCLHLDVKVPKVVFDNVGQNGKAAPVLVWLHGGGFVQGDKAIDGNGEGLLEESFKGGDEGVIFVAVNYRLGLFGWLADGQKSDYAGTHNAGLADQLKAFEWIRDFIHLFGGDAQRITLLSESAGAGSALQHLAAVANTNSPRLFHSAILQSPFVSPLASIEGQDKTYRAVLEHAGAKSYVELRSMASDKIQDANAIVVARSTYGTFTFGPTVDGDYVKGPPAEQLQNTSASADVPILLGHNAHEGSLFTTPFVRNDSDFEAMLRSLFPYAASKDVKELAQAVYPTPGSSTSYSTQTERVTLAMADILVDCQAHYVEQAFPKTVYSYLFSVPTAVHAADLHYTFYASPVTGKFNATVGRTLQQYIDSFAAKDAPYAKGTAPFRSYMTAQMNQNLNVTGIGPVQDDISAERCAGIRKILSGSFA